MDEMQVEQEINRAYARYDSDPRVSGPEDMDAFRDAVRPLVGVLLTDALHLPTLPPGDTWVLGSELDSALLRLNVLAKYATHLPNCACVQYDDRPDVCTCGLAAFSELLDQNK